MKLSDAEKKMVVRLRKQKQSFARWRWLVLLNGVLFIGAGIYALVVLYRCCGLFDSSSVAIAAAFCAPVAYSFLGIGTWMITDTFWNWRGKPEVDLLLKLIESSQDAT